MVTVIESYLAKKELAWSPKTLYSTRCVLLKVAPYLTGEPRALWDFIKETQQGYSRVTTWVRVCGFWDFAKPGEENPYRVFRSENSRLFKDQYNRRPARESMKEATVKIRSIKDPATRKKAMELLYSGMRWSESFTLKDGYVNGKTGERKVSVPKIAGPEYTASYRTFVRALKDVGLKPHTLRKIALTECSNHGASVFELMQIAGWKSLAAATAYIGVREERVEQIMGEIRTKNERQQGQGEGKRTGRRGVR